MMDDKQRRAPRLDVQARKAVAPVIRPVQERAGALQRRAAHLRGLRLHDRSGLAPTWLTEKASEILKEVRDSIDELDATVRDLPEPSRSHGVVQDTRRALDSAAKALNEIIQ